MKVSSIKQIPPIMSRKKFLNLSDKESVKNHEQNIVYRLGEIENNSGSVIVQLKEEGRISFNIMKIRIKGE